MGSSGNNREDFESAVFLNYLIQGMAEGVIFIDEENIIRLCNPVGGAIRGVSGKEIVGNQFLDCHPKATHQRVLRVVDDLKTGRKKELKRTVRLRGRFYEHTYSGVKDRGGRFLGVVAVSRDVTERELLEKELMEHTKKLEHSNQMKELFADIIRHDLINPANIIANYAEIILEEGSSEDIDIAVRGIKKSSDRLIEMIENARKYSMLEDVRDLVFKEADLGEAIKRTIGDFQPHLNEKKIEILHNLDGQYPADTTHIIEDVFSNLVSNAIKYSPEKSTVSIEIADEGKNWLIFVADQAEKIPEGDKLSIFERFKRAGKGSVKGSGLGLAIVKRAVELHKGEVWVEDNPQGGNIFNVRLPKKHPSHKEEANNGR
jgi:PAS domain S-box-containing protein